MKEEFKINIVFNDKGESLEKIISLYLVNKINSENKCKL